MSEEVKVKRKRNNPRDMNGPDCQIVVKATRNNTTHALKLNPGDNTRITNCGLEIFNLPRIDLNDADQVHERIGQFFEIYGRYDLKPSISGLALALNGISRNTLWAMAHGAPTGGCGYEAAVPREVADEVKKTYSLLESMWISTMDSGKVNPVTGIFLAKNYYGFQDKQEYVVQPKAQDAGDYSEDDLKKRYLPAQHEYLPNPDSEE